ncbi:proline dehydrogenase [Neophaeococcomyces mojaviensis]|uniref:Proline dehydrogenase n=1 Tax=Neophaeococcomyces mojaviensis TaxID=3383035 RepID=A0ACC3AHN5_9EURO|nr:proline dehydrogenase [Knufia sp. JES_112]
MKFLANSKSQLFNPDHNRILHAILKRAFYVQFCAGETPAEVRRTINSLKTMGYKGVILGHAREVVLSKEEEKALDSSLDGAAQEQRNQKEIAQWRDDTLATIKLTQQDDFVALKFTGAGRQALQTLKATQPCSPLMREAIHEVCVLAQERGVGLLFDAEQASLQQGIDNWAMYYMRRYNKSGKAVVYGTYQAYAKRAPKILAQHLALARRESFVLGVKLVRGAYIGSDPRELFWDTIEDTHKCYDNLAQCIIQRKYAGLLQPSEGESSEFPDVNFVLASHNADSVRTARAIRDEQARSGQPMIRMAYGQLQGMADHLSCELVKQAKETQGAINSSVEIPQTYKYLVWGSLSLSMKYLLRRAQENKDAVSRTVDARRALGKEIAVRLGLARP